MKKTFLISCLLVASFPVMAASTGHVYVDKNKNGVFDKGEKPMSGVKVSDGLNVVETAADGSFTLPGHAGERFIFITTPSGYKTYNRHYHTIEDRAVHILRIHQFDMLFQPFLITDIAGMNDKSGMLIRCIVTYIIYPFIMILGIENLCIGNMDIFMGAILTQASAIIIK